MLTIQIKTRYKLMNPNIIWCGGIKNHKKPRHFYCANPLIACAWNIHGSLFKSWCITRESCHLSNSKKKITSKKWEKKQQPNHANWFINKRFWWCAYWFVIHLWAKVRLLRTFNEYFISKKIQLNCTNSLCRN